MGRFINGEWVSDIVDKKQVDSLIDSAKTLSSSEIDSKLSALKTEVNETIDILKVRVDKVEIKPIKPIDTGV